MKPMGGTELMLNALLQRLGDSFAEEIEIIVRPQEIDEQKKNILWVHDLPADMPFMASAVERSNFDGIVFVSSWQQQLFNLNADVPFSESVVIKNAIEPIPEREKQDDGVVRLVYHSTPHRGLEILVPVFVELCKKYDNLRLDVFSNFDLYARPELNENYESLYDICRSHEKITYHGTQPNSVVRDALASAHIFGYPSIWRETSCLCAMEAMSARCVVVAPNYGALAETLAGFSIAYDYNENKHEHAQVFAAALDKAIEGVVNSRYDQLLHFQKAYADSFYNWDSRISQWTSYLSFVKNNPKKRKMNGALTWTTSM
jgi:glycosyltransferase involved in cell wall biosynthesis